MSKVRLAVFSLLTVVLTVLPAFPAVAAEPHENPETSPLVYDGTAIFQKYSQAIDHVPAGNTSGPERLMAEASAANIPPELRNTVNGFLSSCFALSFQVLPLQTELENARTLLAQYRVDDARVILASANERLNQSFAALLVMDSTVADTGRWWQVDAAAANSALKRAYNDVRTKLRQVRDLLDLLNKMYAAMLQTEISASLLPSNLSLQLEPEMVFVGEPVKLRGVLSADNLPLPGRIITLLLDNTPVASVLTNAAGIFQKEITIPFRYVPQMKVQAVFAPVGNDIGRYLGVSSDIALLNVLFHRAVLSVSQGTPANPGRDFLVTAAFRYDTDAPPLEERRLIVSLDDEVVFDALVGRDVSLRLPVAANTSVGRHRLSFYSPPSRQYAPVSTVLELEVSRITPVIEVAPPGIFFLPFSRDIRGRAYSAVGPLRNASVEVRLGGWKVDTATGDDGSFRTRLDTGFSLMLLGRQEMRAVVTPVEPWYRTGSFSIGVTVINPLNLAGIVLILTFPVLVFSLRRKKVRLTAPPAVPPPGAPVVKPVPVGAAAASTGGDSLLLTLFKGVLSVVQMVTAILMQPCQTLSEFAREAGPKLGKFAAYFQEFTRLIERYLYSRSRSDDADSERARELSRTLLTGIKNENT